ncbi:MAG: PAS domain S-box protein [Anaerolineae bacterium]|nr:PAS domain S-box protein [Anaerolineae bacterium]
MPDPSTLNAAQIAPQDMLLQVLGAQFYHFAFADGYTVGGVQDDRHTAVKSACERLCLVDANDAFARQYGFDGHEAMLGSGFKFAQMFPGAELSERALADILALGDQTADQVTQQLDREGRTRFIRSVISLQRSETGIRGFYGVQWDVTESYVTRAALEVQNKQLSAIQAIGRLTEARLSVEAFLERVVDLISAAMQYSELAMVAIEFEGKVYGQEKAIESASRIAYGIVIDQQEVGRVHIAYLEQRLFAASESAYIRSVAERIGGYINRVRAESQLVRLSVAVEQTVDGIAVADVDGNIQFVNMAWVRMHGYEPKELDGKHLSTFHNPEQFKEEVGPFIEKVMKESTNEGEVGHIRRNGSVFPAWMTAALLRDEDGNPIGLVATTRDITGQKKMEKALQESGEQFRLIAESIPVPILVSRVTDGVVLYGNGPLGELFGIDIAELIGRQTPDFYYDLSDRKKILGAVRRDGVLRNYEFQVKKVDGTPFWVIASLQVITFGDEPALLVGFVDVTERRAAEAGREQLLIDLNNRTERLQTASEISRAAGSILNSEELIHRSVELIRDRFSYYYVGLFLVDETGEWTKEPKKWAVLRAGTGEQGREMMARGHKLEISGGSMVGQAISLGRARIALDVGANAVLRVDNPLLPDTRSEMALPLMSRGQAIGALTIQSAQEAAFSEVDITVLQIMADQLATAIQTAMLFEQAQLQAERERLVRTIADRIYRATDRESIMRITLQELGQLLGASKSIVRLGTREQLLSDPMG